MSAFQNPTIKTAFEIGSLAGQLNPSNQSYVLNTINALLFSQQVNESKEEGSKKQHEIVFFLYLPRKWLHSFS